MDDEADVAQARMLVGLLHDEIAKISDELEAAELRAHRPQSRGHGHRMALLRRQLYEAHRLLDGLHRRFPETRELL